MQFVKPLTEKEYVECFKYFSERSHEYEDMLELFTMVIDNLNKRSIEILSIGAGTGVFEEQIIKISNVKINITCLEPNINHIPMLEKRNFIVIPEYLSVETKIDKKFDLVLMSHCLYPIKKPIEMIIKSMEFLNSTGKLIIFHQSSIGMYQFISKIWPLINFIDQPIADHSLSIEQIVMDLKNRPSFNYRLTHGYVSSWIDVKDIIQNNIDITHHLLTFFSQTNTKNLDSEIFNKMIQKIKSNIYDEYKYLHPTGILIIQN